MPCRLFPTIIPALDNTKSTERQLSSAFDTKSNKMAGLSDRAEMSFIVIRVVTSLYILAIILSWRICSHGRRWETAKMYVSHMKYVTSWKLLRDKKMYCHLQTTETTRITLLKCSWWKTNLSATFVWCWKKHLAWRLMIPTDKRSQFTATRTKNNTNRPFYSTDDNNYTRIIQKYLGD